FDLPSGTLILTEASTKKRAALHLVQGSNTLGALDRGGVDVLKAAPSEFTAAIRRENHTLKRALTDPTLFDGIRHAYSDAALHRARISPLRLAGRLTDDEIARLRVAASETLQTWIDRLRAETAGRFPEKVTAFHPEMAVHGRYGQPCPICGSPVQRLVYAENE